MLSLLNRIKSWWTNADQRQRVVTLGGIGALLLLLVGTMYFATRPTYTVLLENMSETERADAVEAIKGMGIPVQYGRKGVVEVPESQADDARMGLAKAGKLPSGPNHLSFPDLAKIGPMVSPKVEAETINAILEGRIASTLEKMEGVAAAEVIITRPPETVFQDEQEAPSASVTLTEKGAGMLTPANGRMIANLVCSAVQGMKPDGVYVGTSGLAVLWDGHGADLPSSKGDLDAKTARQWENKIQSALDKTLGADNTRVIVRADVDTAKKTTKITEENPTATPTSSLSMVEEMTNGKGAPRGVAGMDANGGSTAPATPPADGKDSSVYKKKGKDEKFGNNRTETTIEGGEGGLKALAITVAVNSEKVDDIAGVEGLVRGVMAADIETDAAGIAKPNQKFAVKIQPVKFDNSAAAAAKEAEDKRAGAARTQQLLSLLPIAAILVVAFLVAKGIGKISQAALPAPAEEAVATLVVADESLAEETPALPESAEGELGAIERYMEEIASAPASAPALESFPTRVDVPLDSLKQMAAERPEMVATLIKSMLLGEQA